MIEFFKSLKKRRELLIIITAALLIELVSAVQYYQTYHLLENELEKRAESELVMKTIIIKSTLNSAEDILENHIWDLQRSLVHPDSLASAVRRLVIQNRYVCGGFMCLIPDYYPSKGRLYEPYTRVTKENPEEMDQIGSDQHDYTQYDFFQRALTSDEPFWVDPYTDDAGARALVTSYLSPIKDATGKVAGVAGIDVSVEWLGDTIDVRHIYPSSFNLLLTEDGKSISYPSDISKETMEKIVSLMNDSTVERRNSLSGRSTLIRLNIDGEKGTVFYANMKGKPHWQISVVCFDKEVYGALKSLRLKIMVFMLLAFGVLLFMIRNFVNKDRALARTSLEQERMGSELRIASGIQQSMMAMDEAAFEETHDLSVWGVLNPAKEVGGDLYNAFVRDDKLFFCIGDVSGKGVPSALIMAVVKSVFRSIATHENDPANIMTELNKMSCRNNEANIFVTMFVGVLNLPSGHLRYCNAGHEKPVLMKRVKRGTNGSDIVMECQMLDMKPNLPIGLFDDFAYEMQDIYLDSGTTLFLYTDGLTEGRNPEGEQYGYERMLQALASSPTVSPHELVERMVSEQGKFVKTAEQRDDLTMLALCYSPQEEDAVLDEEITLQNDVSQVTAFNTFIKDIAGRLHMGKSLTYQLRLALEEAVVNVMEYAYPSGTTGDIHVRITSNGRRLKCIVTDSGAAFNPTEAHTADITLSAEDRPVGGLGILLVRNLMDSINYERTNGKNVLTMRKDYTAED